jgi:hypothetical protein
LIEIQQLVQDYFRRIRIKQDRHNERLKEDFLLSVFKYEPFRGQLKIPELEIPKWQQEQQLNNKRRQIEATLTSLGIERKRYESVIDLFFKQITSLAGVEIDKESPQFLEWIINKPQIDRIDGIFEIVEDYSKKVADLLSPIDKFLSLVNRFLTDSKKQLEIDSVGYLEVAMKGQKNKTLEALSSGERQILVMLAHLAISEETKRAGIFIVDEPELSLHLKWQEIFVDSILEASPSTQFILATHAPSIILDREDKFVDMS